MLPDTSISFFFFFNDPATTEIYTLSLHDALPICCPAGNKWDPIRASGRREASRSITGNDTDSSAFGFISPTFAGDRKSTRLNSSHQIISYAVFCLKKKIYHLYAAGHHSTMQVRLA